MEKVNISIKKDKTPTKVSIKKDHVTFKKIYPKNSIFKNRIKFKNYKQFAKDSVDGAKDIIEAYTNRKKEGYNKFKKVFNDRIKKLSDNAILQKVYKEGNNKYTPFKKSFKLLVFLLLSIAIISVKNIELLKAFYESIKEFINTTDFKNKKINENMKIIIDLFINQITKLSILKRLLVSFIFINTLVNDIPRVVHDSKMVGELSIVETIKKSLENLVKIEAVLGNAPNKQRFSYPNISI